MDYKLEINREGVSADRVFNIEIRTRRGIIAEKLS